MTLKAAATVHIHMGRPCIVAKCPQWSTSVFQATSIRCCVILLKLLVAFCATCTSPATLPLQMPQLKPAAQLSGPCGVPRQRDLCHRGQRLTISPVPLARLMMASAGVLGDSTISSDLINGCGRGCRCCLLLLLGRQQGAQP